jgi:hypothetical protein
MDFIHIRHLKCCPLKMNIIIPKILAFRICCFVEISFTSQIDFIVVSYFITNIGYPQHSTHIPVHVSLNSFKWVNERKNAFNIPSIILYTAGGRGLARSPMPPCLIQIAVPVEAYMVVRCWGCHIVYRIGSQIAVRSTSCTGHALPPETFLSLVFISVPV